MTTFLAEILPDQKTTEIHKLKNQGKRVAMVGNGINDTTTLEVFTRLCNLSRATMRTIHQRFGLPLGYNLVLTPLAAGFLYPFFFLKE